MAIDPTTAWRPREGRESIAGPTIARYEHPVGALGDSSHKYSSLITALAAVRAKTAYLDGELCGVAEDGLPNFAETQAATEGARGMRLSFTPSTFCISTAVTP
jgi:hypothetical protein